MTSHFTYSRLGAEWALRLSVLGEPVSANFGAEVWHFVRVLRDGVKLLQFDATFETSLRERSTGSSFVTVAGMSPTSSPKGNRAASATKKKAPRFNWVQWFRIAKCLVYQLLQGRIKFLLFCNQHLALVDKFGLQDRFAECDVDTSRNCGLQSALMDAFTAVTD